MAIRVKALFFFILLGTAATVPAQQTLPASVDFVCLDCRPADALVALSKQTGINIAFNDKLFQRCSPVNVDVRRVSFLSLLETITACSKIAYQVDGNQVVLYRKNSKYIFSGYIQDAASGERLIGASIRVISNKTTGAVSNEFGFFSLQLEEGDYRVMANYIGYQPVDEDITLTANRFLTLKLQQDNRLPEVVISAPSGGTEREHLIGSPKDLPLETLRFLPMPGGEADLLRLAAFQPGVQTGVDGMGGLHIRGGNADQNLFLLDDVPVYSPGHALGLFSIFNPSTVSSARLWKGDFPARYSGRVSSVLDVRTRDGNFKNFEATANTGLFATSLAVEGPVVRNKSSFLLGMRFTYLDPWVDFFSKRGNLLNIAGDRIRYQFFDANGKWNYIFSDRDRIYLSYYTGGDVFRNSFDQDYTTTKGLVIDQYTLNSNWGNAIAALRWNHLLRKNLFTNTTFRYSRFYYQSRLGFNSKLFYTQGKESVLADYAQLYQTLIRDWSGKTDFTFYVKPRFTLRWGMSYTAHEFQPGALSANFLQPGQSPAAIDSLETLLVNNERLDAGEAEAYLDAEFSPFKNWRIDAGLNYSVFNTKKVNFSAWQPRIRLQHSGEGGWSQWAGYYRNTQFLHQIGTFNISLPFELWVPSTKKVLPEQVWQTSFGLGWEGNGWGWQIEGYYKRLERVLSFLSSNEALYTGGAEDAKGWEDRITTGVGSSRGLEFFLEKNRGNTTGSLAYTISKTDRQFPEINSGKTYPFRYDRLHDIKLTLRQRVTRWLDLSVVWAFATGNPITLAGVKFRHESVEGQVERDVYVYTEVNGYRLPSYHRLDAALNVHFMAGHSKHAIQFGVYNSYNRANPFFLYVDGGSNIQGKAVQYTLLPVLPAFRYQINF